MYQLTIKDETASGKILNEIIISFEKELTTVRDIVKTRVYAEVERYNSNQTEYFNGLVQPNETEVSLNGYKMKAKRIIDPERQFYIACDSFLSNGYFILIDNRQAEELDEDVLLTNDTNISFVKLTPLVGG